MAKSSPSRIKPTETELKEKLVSLLTQPFNTTEELCDRVNENLQSHISGVEQFDDITMVLFRRNL